MVSPKTRYLVFFQYFGTKYSGVMETSVNQSGIGVQNYLEKAAQNLKPVVPIKFHISSRTDSGVHALCNTAHLDIQRAPGKPAFRERELIRGLNHCLKPEPIRILSAYRVTSDFHARFSALSRTYIYRLLLGCAHWSEIPVFERDLCWAPLGGYLDVPAMQDAARFLLGTHDFSTFRSLNSETPFQSPIRTIVQAEIQPSSGFLAHHYESRGLEFWELKFRSKSFLYRQCHRRASCHTGTWPQRGEAPRSLFDPAEPEHLRPVSETTEVTEPRGRMESFVFHNLRPCRLSGKTKSHMFLLCRMAPGPAKTAWNFYFLASEHEAILSVAQRRAGRPAAATQARLQDLSLCHAD